MRARRPRSQVASVSSVVRVLDRAIVAHRVHVDVHDGLNGAFLIFIACFSYINLATARSLLRLKEVGLRKIMGGRSSQLALQFLTESALVTLIAFVLALGAAIATLPVFGNLVGRTFALTDLVPAFLTNVRNLVTTPSGTVTGLAGGIAGNTISVAADSIAPGASVTITFMATLINAVPVNQLVTNTASLTYTSLPGSGSALDDGLPATINSTPGASGSGAVSLTGKRSFRYRDCAFIDRHSTLRCSPAR